MLPLSCLPSGLTFWSANAAADSTQQLVGDIECAHLMRMVVEAKALGGYVLDSIALLIVEGRT